MKGGLDQPTLGLYPAGRKIGGKYCLLAQGWQPIGKGAGEPVVGYWPPVCRARAPFF